MPPEKLSAVKLSKYNLKYVAKFKQRACVEI